MHLRIGRFMLSFDKDLRFETYDSPGNYYGVIFFTSDGSRFDVLDGLMGERLLLNYPDGTSKDMPFHLGTASFLPGGVGVREVVSTSQR